MLDPIYGGALKQENSCDAHLIPQAIRAGRTVRSNLKFDNDFGRLNDCHIVDFIENSLGGARNVEVIALDPNDHTRQVGGIFRTKSTEEIGPDGIRRQQITIKHSKKTSDAWREAHIHTDKLVRMKFKEDDWDRIILSMLHSAHLTAYYHLKDEYLLSPSTIPVRETLAGAIKKDLSPDIRKMCRLLTWSAEGLRTKMGQQSGGFNFAVSLDPNPLCLLDCGGKQTLVAVLPYHEKWTFICLLPYPSETGHMDWLEVMGILASRELRPSLSVGVITPVPDGNSLQKTLVGISDAMKNPSQGKSVSVLASHTTPLPE